MAKKSTVPNKNSHRQQVVSAQLTNYQGPIPHPDILRGFDQLVPGTAQRLIKLAEDESLHRRRLEALALNSNIETQQKQIALDERQIRSVSRSDAIGQIFGFIICLICIASATYLGLKDHEWLAGAIAAIPTGALIKAFILNKK
ncbi:DUF2335 domain-containing protein [Methylosarcina fibrata]|uniref:DUF2335 domain-containing protein n=1 Tax=Methylosarcina fibrata TaxID=105972 RepID=UPI000A03AF10|nr:DUF2335 domain-containing protein [Methylosarcina fibrata]